eukprot:1160077-Pelagomonas_calceolata.AAC.7
MVGMAKVEKEFARKSMSGDVGQVILQLCKTDNFAAEELQKGLLACLKKFTLHGDSPFRLHKLQPSL